MSYTVVYITFSVTCYWDDPLADGIKRSPEIALDIGLGTFSFGLEILQ